MSAEIKAVIFDADGVMTPPWRFARYLERKHDLIFAFAFFAFLHLHLHLHFAFGTGL